MNRNRVKELRTAQEKSQERLASAAGVTRQAIGKMEQQNSQPGGVVLVRLAAELGVSPSYLAGETDTPERADRLPQDWVQAVEEWIAIGLIPAEVRQAVRAWRVAHGVEVGPEQRPIG